MVQYQAVKVFSATRARERESLGDAMSEWLAENLNKIEVIDTRVIQSSDQQFHCLTIVVFYRFT